MVGLEELGGPLSWVVLAEGVGIDGRAFRELVPCGTLNHSSFINGIPVMLACDSHIVPPIISVEKEGSACTIIRSLHGSGGKTSRAPSALINRM